MKVDVLKPKQISKFCQKIIKRWGSIHILVNNVGGRRWGDKNILKTQEKVWSDVYDKNVMAAIRFTKFFIPLMKKQKWSRVITVTSKYGRESGGRPWFNIAKSAEISLMKSLSKDKSLVRYGITFNSIAP